ncbi:MAG: MerR family transcriptional regulator [Alphaproteobacteria bacterium]|nr:MerR family transcriptional regulator [Alphaproteobacteria bacterium]
MKNHRSSLLEMIDRRRAELDRTRGTQARAEQQLEGWFTVELTFTSNAIEGNTLTRRETATVIEKGLGVAGKTLREHLEAANHAKALAYVRGLARRKPARLSEADILDVHRVIMTGIDDANAGRYRSVPVRISGAAVVLPNPRKVPDLMAQFVAWLEHFPAKWASGSPKEMRPNKELGGRLSEHPVSFAAEAHYRFVSIHPFVDGNGRTGRLLMNLILMASGYPPAIIRKADRIAYLAALETAQLGGAREPYDRLIERAVLRSIDIVLNAVKGRSRIGDIDRDGVMKIGELAKRAGVTIATVRHWVSHGLITVAETTPSGYQMFSADMVDRCRRIRELQAKRMTLTEIKRQV